MLTFDDYIELSEELRYKYLDVTGFATISDNTKFTDYNEDGNIIGNITELAFLYCYLNYDYEIYKDADYDPTTDEVIRLIKTRKTDPYINWTALYDYFDELKQTQWSKAISEDIDNALEIFEPFRGELAGIKNNQQLWI